MAKLPLPLYTVPRLSRFTIRLRSASSSSRLMLVMNTDKLGMMGEVSAGSKEEEKKEERQEKTKRKT